MTIIIITLLTLTNLIKIFGLKITISECTRITENSSSCIITNLDADTYAAGVIDPCLSDHFGLYLLLRRTKSVTNQSIKYIRSFNCNNINNFKYALNYINFNDIFAKCPLTPKIMQFVS